MLPTPSTVNLSSLNMVSTSLHNVTLVFFEASFLASHFLMFSASEIPKDSESLAHTTMLFFISWNPLIPFYLANTY